MSYHSDLSIRTAEDAQYRDPWQTERWENFGGYPGYPRKVTTPTPIIERKESTTVKITCRKCRIEQTFDAMSMSDERYWTSDQWHFQLEHSDHGIGFYFS